MGTKTIRILFLSVATLLILWIAVRNYIPGMPAEDELGGAYIKQERPGLSVAGWFSGTFQDQFGKYVEEKAGYRSTFIRIRNQIDFDLFKHVHAEDVCVGQDDYLLRPTEFYDLNGNYGFYDDEWREKFRGVKHFRDELAKRQVPLIIVIAPSKSHFYREFIPSNRLNPKAESFYKKFLSMIDTSGLNYIDMNAWFLQMKGKTPYTLYGKSGIHWTEYGAILALDSILRYAGALTGKQFSGLQWDEVKVMDHPQPRDYPLDDDILLAINLWKPFKVGTFAYPVLKQDHAARKPNMLIVGDSYYNALMWSGVHDHVSDPRSAFWYYGKEAFTPEYSARPVTELDILKEFEGRDFVLMIYTPANLFDPFWYLPGKVNELVEKK